MSSGSQQKNRWVKFWCPRICAPSSLSESCCIHHIPRKALSFGLESWNNYSSYTSLQSHLVIHILNLELAALGILVTLLTLFSLSLDESWYRTFLSFPWVLGIQDQVQMFGEQALCPQRHLPDPLLTFMYWTGHWTGHMKASWWVCILYYMSSRFREKGLAHGYISNYNLSSLHGDFV